MMTLSCQRKPNPHSQRNKSPQNGLRLLLVAMLPSMAIPCALAAPTVAPEQALQQVVEKFTQAQVGFDAAVLRDLTAPEYIEVSPLGEVDPRDKMLGFYEPANKVEAPSAVTSDFNIRLRDITGVVIVKVAFQVKGAAPGTPEHALRETFVARHTPEGWKLVSAQYTPIHLKPAQPAPAPQPH